MFHNSRGCFFALSLIAFCLFCAPAFSQAHVQPISIVNLIATPAPYHHKRVVLRGYLSIEKECTAVFLSEQDAKHHVSKNALWLDIPEKNAFKHLHGTYVLVEGVFDMNSRGHLKLYSGSIGSIERIIP